MRQVLLFAIGLYRRFISPHKGFGCAYRVHTGRGSCSALGYRAVRRHGVFRGLGLIRQRTRLCGAVYRQAHPQPRLKPERGVCDIGCDLPCDGGCDLPGGRSIFSGCDIGDVCDCCSCDGPSRQRHQPRPRPKDKDLGHPRDPRARRA